MSSGGLTEEQRTRIEENRRKALEKRAALLSQRQPKNAPPRGTPKTSSTTVKCDAGKFASNCVPTTGEERGLFSSSRNKTSVPQKQPYVQSVGERPSLNDFQAKSCASNSYMYTNCHPAVNSQNTSAGSTTSTSKTSNEPTSLNSFQNKISKFYRPQNVSSCSAMRKFETKPNSNSSMTSSSVSVSASNRTGPSKASALNTLNVKGKSEKTVKGNCVLISRQRFAVVVPYQAQLIGIFKTIPSRSYGKFYPILRMRTDLYLLFHAHATRTYLVQTVLAAAI